MILSHSLKFIFIKTRKTAGTSLEIALSRFCGPDDIITPLSKTDEATRRRLGYRGAQNYRVPYRDYGKEEFKKLWRVRFDFFRAKRFWNHMSVDQLLPRIGADVWKDYFTFTIERNPWDKMLSFYFYKTRAPREAMTLEEFLHSYKSRKLSDFDRYSHDGHVAVDHVIQYDRLQAELPELVERLGLPDALELPRAKSGFRTVKKPYDEIISSAERVLIDEQFQREIDYFGYRFDRQSDTCTA